MTRPDDWNNLLCEITSAKTVRDVEAPGRRLAAIMDRGRQWASLVGELARRDNKAATALESAMVLREKALAELVGWDQLAFAWCRFYQLHDEWDRWAEQVVIGLLPPMAALSTQEAWTFVVQLLETAEDDTVISVIGAGPIEDLLSSDPEPVAALIEGAAPDNIRLRQALDHVWQMHTPDQQFLRVKRVSHSATERQPPPTPDL
jgi:hypothetical protein